RSMDLLSRPLILEIHEAAVGLGLHRPTLLRGIDPAFVAGLAEVPNLASQLLSDLSELNRVERLRDQTVPLAQWLENALAVAGSRAESAVFRLALESLPNTAAAPSQPRVQKAAAREPPPIEILFLAANPAALTRRALD